MRKYLAMVIFLLCVFTIGLGFVYTEGPAAGHKLEIDGKIIDLDSYISVANGQIVINDLSDLASLNIETSFIPAENRIVLKHNNACISLQFVGAELEQSDKTYIIKAKSEFKMIALLSAKTINLLDNYKHIQLVTDSQERKNVFLFYDIKTAAGIINIKPIAFKKEPAKYIELYSKYYPVAKNYVPSDMVNLPKTMKATLSEIAIKFNGAATDSLIEMFDVAYKEGLKDYCITSSYRDYSYQQLLFTNRVNSLKKKMKSGYEEAAARIVARPGTSEHQSGLAMDVSILKLPSADMLCNTPQGKWLGDYSWKYGFILRYPEDKIQKTEIIYEPWHFRYIGYPHSKVLHDYNLCLEEYHENLAKYSFYTVSDDENIYVIAKDSSDSEIYESEPIILNASY